MSEAKESLTPRATPQPSKHERIRRSDSSSNSMEVESDELDEFKVKTNSDYEEDTKSRESSADKSLKYRGIPTVEAEYEESDKQPFLSALNHLKLCHKSEEKAVRVDEPQNPD